MRIIPSVGFTFIHIKEDNHEDSRIFSNILDGSIDLIVVSMVLHHIKDVVKVILELRRILSPTGFVRLLYYYHFIDM